ncbi:hypothetical protein JVT61DRAFT_12106 [Boletus reticuloceps]|uniref:KOW domain-containing protein n=1 Tax=Boletus reticuloceps TaxID=495285 RepID=A0A8I3A588_9AGAM|nr:hypothetical protein JVT61DRAFT_12106 [Boletus reticuloceps]
MPIPSNPNAQTTTCRSLLHDLDAWAVVLEWAMDAINFPTYQSKMQGFGNRYVPSEWNAICNHIFDLSEDGDAAAATAYVEEQQRSRGLLPPHSAVGSSEKEEQSSGPVPSPAVGSNAKGKRKAEDGKRRRKQRKRIRYTKSLRANPFLDLETQVDNETDSSTVEVDDDDNFIDPEDVTETTSNRDVLPQTCPASKRARSSAYTKAINGITKHCLLSNPDVLDDDEYDAQLAHLAGHGRIHRVLDDAQIWESIRDWLLGALSYDVLVDLIDFQYGSNLKIQYWEDFLSKLAFFEDLDKRDEVFNGISLSDHLRQLADYQSQLTRQTGSLASLQTLEDALPSSCPHQMFEDTPGDAAWAVKIAPRSSVEYIVSTWKNVRLDATVHKFLPGRVTVRATHPNIFLDAVPLSRRSCILGWSLIPLEDRISTFLRGRSIPSIPGWYTVLKRGMYKGDIAYALDFDEDASELQLLVAPRWLKRRKQLAEHECFGQVTNVRRLFSPEEHRACPQPPRYGLLCYLHKEQTFIAGLLLMKVKINQVTQVTTPSPQQISPYVTSMVNPPFMKATHKKYNQLFWKAGDRVLVSDSTHLGKSGSIVAIDHETRSAVVRLCEGPEYLIPFASLSRLYHIGDVVRVIKDPFSDHLSTQHELMGRSGLIVHIDHETSEVTVTEGNAEFQVLQHLLESHSPDQQVWAPVGVINPSAADNSLEQVEVGDQVDVKCGPHTGGTGFVLSVQRPAGTLTFVSTHPVDRSHKYRVSIDSVTFTPDHRALKLTPDRGYNVKRGDAVVVIRGDHRGKAGTVVRVLTENRALEVASLECSNSLFQLPVTYFAHAFSLNNRDVNEHHLGKEVLIIAGEFRGWRGTLINVRGGRCIVARGVCSLDTCPTDSVVIRGSVTRLSGRALTPWETLTVTRAFARTEITTPSPSSRARTPPPLDSVLQTQEAETPQAVTCDPWKIDDSDREQLNGPALKVHGFLLHPSVLKSLENLHAVFQITGGRDSYIGRLAKTRVPNPLQIESGVVPRGEIAVSFTARTKGACLLHETMSETTLKVFHPSKRNTLCMVIKEQDGGEPIGTVLSVTRVHKGNRVEVQRLDGVSVIVPSLPLSRVILVERHL